MKRRRRGRIRDENWEQTQARIVAETSAFLTEHLEHPEQAVAIPVVPAGMGEFPKSITAAFWRRVLFE